MINKESITKTAKLLTLISFLIPMVNFVLIINWFFKITPYQGFEGMPLMAAPLICFIGLILGLLSRKIKPAKLVKVSIIFNSLLILLSILYWHLGTLLLGI